VNDIVDRRTAEILAGSGVRLIALRCAGFNNVDLNATADLGLGVVRVPAYSPHAVAEHTVALVLTLNRNIHGAHARVREGNFAIGGLLGFDLYGKTVGLIGAGKIGMLVAKIMSGFGAKVLISDPGLTPEQLPQDAMLTGFDELLSRSDIISLHCPLNAATHHLLNRNTLSRTKPGVMLINTGRGALIDTGAVVALLKSGHIGHLGLDVYEEEADVFFEDLSGTILRDDVLARLLTFPNVLVTAHQGFFTREAMEAIADTTIRNLSCFEQGRLQNQVGATPVRP
jgi:D-lactate dehydrogenase